MPGWIERLQQWSKREAPREICGFLVGPQLVSECWPAKNLAPPGAFEISPEDHLKAHYRARTKGWRVLGYYHSHPGGPARPSLQDQALETLHLIVTPTETAAFFFEKNAVKPLPLRLVFRDNEQGRADRTQDSDDHKF